MRNQGIYGSRRCIALLVLALAALALSVTSAQAVRSHAPRITVKVIRLAHRPLRAGDWIDVRWSLANASRGKLRRAPLRFYLSPITAAHVPPGAVALNRPVTVPALGGGKTAYGKARLRLPGGLVRGKRRHHPARAAVAPQASTAQHLLACVNGTCVSANAQLPVDCGIVSSAACSGPSNQLRLSGQVLYMKRECFGGPESEAPLPDAKLVLTSADGKKEQVQLASDGTYENVQVTGTLPITATVILDSTLISVQPAATPGAPYEIPLGVAARIDPATGQPVSLRRFVAQGAGPAGASSIFAILDRGARVAVAVSPVPIPKVTARWRFASNLTTWLGDVPDPPGYVDGDNAIEVNGTAGGSVRAEFTAFPLLHEYGHHVLKQVADPGVTSGGTTGPKHGFGDTFPGNPALPWSEGFADAFAAIAQDNPVLTLACRPAMDLSTFPASADAGSGMQPQPASQRNLPLGLTGSRDAQYNETVDAGVVWQTSIALGVTNSAGIPNSGALLGGFSRVLKALNAYHNTFGGPTNMRQVRDAMILGGAEQTQDHHDAVSTAFQMEGVIGFGAAVQTDLTPSKDAICPVPWDSSNPGGGGCEESTVISIAGPGYSCMYQSKGSDVLKFSMYTQMQNLGSGGIPYAWQSNCYGGPGAMWLRLPFPAGGPQSSGAGYTVTFQVNCTSHIVNDPNTGEVANGKCPSTYHVQVQLNTRQATGDGQDGIQDGAGVYNASTDATPGTAIKAAAFAADGSSCEILGRPCQ